MTNNTLKEKIQYPFTAIVGQENMKKALILNVINPKIGGVLIRGEKGTAKSTAVRSLVELLPEKEVAMDCAFQCNINYGSGLCDECSEKQINGKLDTEKRKMRVINLPISATEDRVVGTLDIEHTIKTGEKRFEPGIFANANGNILYVDEVNLLEDHIVDILLDAAAMGVNTVEREGVSYSHPANFILVGTMNPEEGDLRPQLLDRFGLVTDIVGEKDKKRRVEIIKRRIEYEENPINFSEKYETQQKQLSEDINKAIEILISIIMPDELIELIAEIAIDMGVDGHRADISMIKTAKTIAAYHHRHKVTKEDILEAAEFVLPHRMRRKPFEESLLDLERLKKWK